MQSSKIEKRIAWVDVAKFMAIIAVMIDHTGGILYKDEWIAYFSCYSVSLFVVLMGVTNYWSYNRYKGSVIEKVKTSCWKVLKPYLMATFIYSILIDQQFDALMFLTRVIYFDASGPFYYVLLYLQLVVAAPIVYYIFEIANSKKYGIAIEIVGMLGVLGIASLTVYYTNILNVYGGGGKLFGGTYLCLMYIGMLIGKYCEKISIGKNAQVLCFVISIMATILWWKFIVINQSRIDAYIPFGRGINPPSLSFGLYAVLMSFSIYLLEGVISSNDNMRKVFGWLASMGSHTLYIFLYHKLFLDFVFPKAFGITGIYIDNMWIKRVVYFLCMIGGSIIIEVFLSKVYFFLSKAYEEK